MLPNAGGPAITILGATVAMMIGAAILVESVFGLNGIGAYLTNAVNNSDRFAVIGGVLVIGVIIVAISFAGRHRPAGPRPPAARPPGGEVTWRSSFPACPPPGSTCGPSWAAAGGSTGS